MPGTEEEDYHQINGQANKAILQQLIDNSDKETTAEILKCYRVGASDSDIRKAFYAFKVLPLKQAAGYLHIETEGKLKANIISEIITRVESLLMELCGVCSEYYHNTLEDKPLYSCILCNQGCHQSCYAAVHQTIQEMDPKFHKSLQFMCTSCLKTDEPPKDETTKAVVKVKKSPTKLPVQPSNEAVVDQGDQLDDEQIDEGEDGITIETCPSYKWGRCPNYEECSYRHPPRCWNWLRDGKCSYRKKCKYHHPPLCKYSKLERKCFNTECKYFHLTKTLRYNQEDEQLKGSLHAANYQSQHQNQQPPLHQTNSNPQPAQPQQLNRQQAPPLQSQPTGNQYAQQTRPVGPNMQQGNPPQNIATFLVSIITPMINSIKEEFRKEIADLKQTQNTNPVTSTAVTMPMMLSHPNPGLQFMNHNPVTQRQH